MKVTEPVGVGRPDVAGETVAVNVTVWPKTDGLFDEMTFVVVLALLTVWPPIKVAVLVVKLVLAAGL
jgi:hypothetical protein